MSIIQRYDPEPDADACSRMAVVPLGEYVLHVDYANDLAAMQARAEKAEAAIADITAKLSVMLARAERAEYFVRIIAEPRKNPMSESEVAKLVKMAHATLPHIPPKGTL